MDTSSLKDEAWFCCEGEVTDAGGIPGIVTDLLSYV
jgi:hypothetical protein